MPFGLDVGDYGQRCGWLGRPELRTTRPKRFGRQWFKRVQLDWVELLRREVTEQYSKLRRRVAMAQAEARWAKAERARALAVPVSYRTREARRKICAFHAARSIYRKQLRRFARFLKKHPSTIWG